MKTLHEKVRVWNHCAALQYFKEPYVKHHWAKYFISLNYMTKDTKYKDTERTSRLLGANTLEVALALFWQY